MSEERDLIVIGAGPAGAAAAIAAAECGMTTTVIDDGPAAGGQIYRAPPAPWRVQPSADPGLDYAEGTALRERLAASGATHLRGHSVWSATTGFDIHTVSVEGERSWRAPRIIAATGVTERIFPFPGWTTPGVSGLAAATNLMKSQQILPGRRTLVAGAGPLVYAVAAAIIAGGGKVAAIADLGSRSDWLATLPSLLGSPGLFRRGLGWRASIARAGVPVFYRHHVLRVQGDSLVTAAEIAPVDAHGSPLPGAPATRIEVDSVVVGHGLVPSVEITRLLQARHVYRAVRGGWVADRDAYCRTSVDGLYAAGDCGGVAGAIAAALSGSIAGHAAARDAGRLSEAEFQKRTEELLSRHRAADRTGQRMSRLMAARPGMLDAITSDTIVCRCEDLTRAKLDDALDAGAADCNELKAWTRCGMGPCQGRTCGEVAAELVARRVGGRSTAGHWTARVPLRPVHIDQLAAACTYAEIWNSPAGRIATAILPAENVAHLQPPIDAAQIPHAGDSAQTTNPANAG